MGSIVNLAGIKLCAEGSQCTRKIGLLLMCDCFPSIGTKGTPLVSGRRCWLSMCIIFTSALGSIREFPGGAIGNEPSCQCRKRKRYLIPGSGRSPGGGQGNSLQYSCLENPMDRGAWRVTVHGVSESQTRLKQLSTHTWAPLAGTMPSRVKQAALKIH